MISAELPSSQLDRELYDLVKKYNVHRHSHYRQGRTRNRQCRFGYDTNEVNPNTFIDETCNRVVYRRRTQQDLKVLPYSLHLTRKYRCHINVERAQGGGAVA